MDFLTGIIGNLWLPYEVSSAITMLFSLITGSEDSIDSVSKK